MKRSILIAFLVAALALIGWIYYRASIKPAVPDALKSASVPNEYPNMVARTLEGKITRLRDLEGSNILIFFQPDCDHCQREAKAMGENLDLFAKYKLHFITVGTNEEIIGFANDYGLSNRDNITFMSTTIDEILAGVGAISTPSVYIFREGRLVKMLSGEKTIEEISSWL